MAAYDIMPYASPLGGHMLVQSGRIAASTARVGEPVVMADGDLTVMLDNGTTICGVLANAPAGSGFGFEDPSTGAAVANGAQASYYTLNPTTQFTTKFVSSDGTGTINVIATLTRAHVGDLCSIITGTMGTAATHFGLDTSASIKVAQIVDVLDTMGRSANSTQFGTAERVVFTFGPFAATAMIQYNGGM